MNCIIGNGLFQRLALAALAIAAALACAVLWNATRAPEASAHGEHPHSSNSRIVSCSASPSNPSAGDTVTLRASAAYNPAGDPLGTTFRMVNPLDNRPAIDAYANMYVVFMFLPQWAGSWARGEPYEEA